MLSACMCAGGAEAQHTLVCAHTLWAIISRKRRRPPDLELQPTCTTTPTSPPSLRAESNARTVKHARDDCGRLSHAVVLSFVNDLVVGVVYS